MIHLLTAGQQKEPKNAQFSSEVSVWCRVLHGVSTGGFEEGQIIEGWRGFSDFVTRRKTEEKAKGKIGRKQRKYKADDRLMGCSELEKLRKDPLFYFVIVLKF